MMIGGVQKNSFIDYPGRISCVLFLSGCNFTCPYCHNPELVRGQPTGAFCPSIEEFYEFLDQRRFFLEGVVISGGEPTLHAELPSICTNIKKRGYQIKLDTNGSRPEIILRLIKEGLVDFVAMDIKTAPDNYAPIFTPYELAKPVKESIGIVLNLAPAYEFRTTCVQPIITETIIDSIGRLIKGADRYVLQSYQDLRVLDPEYFSGIRPAFSPDQMIQFKQVAQKWVGDCIIR
jgi:pyruvate formate lyase activating enzyme